MQNIIVAIFEVESEGYQAFTEIKQNPGEEKSLVSQAVLVKKEADGIKVLESFDTGAQTTDDMLLGGLLGAAVGILGGPVGVLLGGSYGYLIGANVDLLDAVDNASLLEQISGKLVDGEVALIGLADEEDESVFDNKLSKFKVVIARFDAAVVAQEVEEAGAVQDEMARLARMQLRKEKTDEFKQKVEEQRNKIHEQFKALKEEYFE